MILLKKSYSTYINYLIWCVNELLKAINEAAQKQIRDYNLGGAIL